MSKRNPVVHFEMPYDDKDRVAKFYESAFGWAMNMTGEEMGNYVVAHTSDTDENNMVKTPGTINGGFYAKAMTKLAPVTSVVISVDDIHDGIKAVKDAGGEVLGEPIEIPGIGMYVSFNDTEGNRVSLLQAMRK